MLSGFNTLLAVPLAHHVVGWSQLDRDHPTPLPVHFRVRQRRLLNCRRFHRVGPGLGCLA